jgi:hypothetical protein
VPVFDQHYIVIGFFARMLFLRVVELDAERVPLAVEIDSYFFHSSVPGLMFLVKYAESCRRRQWSIRWSTSDPTLPGEGAVFNIDARRPPVARSLRDRTSAASGLPD